ncbi:transposase [Clostridium sp. DJ247]|uniref:transposase n=1 Tax=Clostridium sp. DJ247 TaxID=2726188 RepID=UPI0016294A19|nr:transposase [Clostridium sp. DJ247]MBC2580588.1 transposase [Clostridium sp. DJ247]
MNNITYSQDNCKEETTSTWLVAVMQFGLKINFFKPFENFKLKMKKVKYSVYQKLIITMMSIVIGCETTKDINEKLGVEKLAANMFDMDEIPDQSQINLLLTRMDSDSTSQLQNIHHQLFMEHNNSIHSTQRVVVDCDQTGLIANGKTFELAEKGYFAKKKNQSGYQLAAAFTGEHSETVAMFLDLGSTHCNKHYVDLLTSILSKYKDQLREGNLILRTDSSFGSLENIEKLLSIPKLKFITKGYSTVKAKNLAKNISYSEYTQADKAAWVYELPENNGVRYIIVQTLSKKGKLKYSLLVSNISKREMSSVELFHFYNKRQTIEAFFKMAKNVYNIKNLRTSKFYGIYSFLWLVFITHNLISQFKSIVLYGTQLETVGVRVLVKSIGNIKGFVKRTAEGIKVNIPPLTKLSTLIANALCTPKYEQLTFNI